MFRWKFATGVLVISAALAVLFAPAPAAQAQERGVQLSGTIFGAYDYTFEGEGAWVGHALISFGNQPAVLATFVDRNTSFGMRPNGAIYGTETITMSLPGGTFKIFARFEGVPGSTPQLYTLNEVGTIGEGTGKYSGISGHVSVHGPFLFPGPPIPNVAPPWMAQMHGSVQGI